MQRRKWKVEINLSGWIVKHLYLMNRNVCNFEQNHLYLRKINSNGWIVIESINRFVYDLYLTILLKKFIKERRIFFKKKVWNYGWGGSREA